MAAAPRVLSHRPPRVSLIQTAFRLSSEDFELLDLIRARYRLANRVEALRFVLRFWKARISEEAGE